MTTLILAIAGTATASKMQKKIEPCEEKDPLMVICLNQTETPCCELNGWPYPPICERS